MKDTMKAQVFYEPSVMRQELRPIPQIAADELLIRVRAVGVCGSDVAYFFGRSPLETPNGQGPLILGHGFAGEGVAVGAIPGGLGLFEPGDRVLANPVQNCNACPQCARSQANLCAHVRTKGVSTDGAFAEYTTLRYTHAHKFADNVSFEQAALCEPLACACYGVQKLDVQIGDSVVIFGPGAIGLMMLRLIKARGAGTVAMVGVLDFGLEKALALGADAVYNTADVSSKYYAPDIVQAISDLTEGELANRVIVPTAAKAALQGALQVSGRKSNIVYFGLPGEDTVLEVPLLDTLVKDKSINVSWLAPFTWDAALKALRGGVVDTDALITHRFPLGRLEEAIRLIDDNARPDKIKAIIQM